MQTSAQNNKNNSVLYYNTGEHHYFVGKALGYVDDRQFAAINKNAKLLCRKLNSMPRMDFCDLMSNKSLGLRLVFLTKNKHYSPYIILSGIITNIHSFINHTGFGELSFVDNKQNLFSLEMEI